MRRTVGLRSEPSVRQTEAILSRVERSLTARGVPPVRHGPGRLRFRMPPVWRAPRAGILHAITSGTVLVTAGAGERRQVHFDLGFAGLRISVLLLTGLLAVFGWELPRLTLLNALLVLWLVSYGVPWFLATRRFRGIVEDAARDVIERRATPRDTAAQRPVATDTSPDPDAR